MCYITGSPFVVSFVASTLLKNLKNFSPDDHLRSKFVENN